MAIDIVCGKDVQKAGVDTPVGRVPAGAPETDPSAGTKRFWEGNWYYFCSLACRLKFTALPDETIANAKERGWLENQEV